MKNGMGLYFQFEIEDCMQSLSLIQRTLQKIKQLEESGVTIKYLELRAQLSAISPGRKEIWMKIDSKKRTYTTSDRAFNWENAYASSVKSLEDQILFEEADYTHDAAIIELNLPQMEYAHSQADG